MREKYESLSVVALKDLAKARGLKNISALKKAEVVDAMVAEDRRLEQIKKHEEEAARQKENTREKTPKETVAAEKTATETITEITEEPKEEEPIEELKFKVGDKVKPLKLVNYNGTPLVQYDKAYTIMEINGDRVVLGAPRGSKGTLEIWAAMNINDIEKI